jgi:hypothetical protein
MSKEIKTYKKLTAIKLKDWRLITTEVGIWDIAKLLNENDFITIWSIWFWKYEVKTFEEFEPTDIDCFIYSQPKDISRELEKIMEERKNKNLKTNWTKHLWNIYENRFLNK